jgi:glutathione synthase/RimK-type ligase-like ATP-grasp enzyme
MGADCEFVHVNEIDKLNGKDAAYVVRHILKLDYEALSKKTRIVNSICSSRIAKDKIETTKILENANLPQPEYVLTENFEDIIRFTKEKGQTIMKFPYGCAGKLHTILVCDNGSLAGYNTMGRFKVDAKKDCVMVGKGICFVPPYLVQEFISSDGSETNDRVYRVYVTGDKANFGTVRKKDNVSSLSESIINIAQGAHYEFMPELDSRMRELALKTAELVGFDCGVVDMLKDSKGQIYIIECDCDGKFLLVDRKFMKMDDYCDKYSFNKMIGQRLIEIAEGADYRR